MRFVIGFSEFASAIDDDIRIGVIADTNVLIAASYDLDPANAEAVQFFDLLADYKVPVFCNVNVRSEFLEIHRRIIFTEALLDFESDVEKTKLSRDLVSKLNSIRSQAEKRIKQAKSPSRLPEAELKEFKIKMTQVNAGGRDLWTVLCEDRDGKARLIQF